MDWTFKVILCRVIYLYSTVFKIEKSKHKILKPRQMNINVGICVFFKIFFCFFVESFFCCFFFLQILLVNSLVFTCQYSTFPQY